MLGKYIRAFIKTISLMMRGGELPAQTNMPYRHWSKQTISLVMTVFDVSDKYALPSEKRKMLKAKIDGREMSLQTVLQAILFHAQDEYPYLLNHLTDKSITTIEAINWNDEYALSRFIDDSRIESHDIRQALTHLHRHLKQIPNKTLGNFSN